MTIFEKIRIRRHLRNKETFRFIFNHGLINKDILKYYNTKLPKYGFKLLVTKTDANQNVWSYWCNPSRAKNIKVFDVDQALYADDKIIVDMHKASPCEGCAYYSKCFNEN